MVVNNFCLKIAFFLIISFNPTRTVVSNIAYAGLELFVIHSLLIKISRYFYIVNKAWTWAIIIIISIAGVVTTDLQWYRPRPTIERADVDA